LSMTKSIGIVADNQFTPSHSQHLQQIKLAAGEMLESKYRRGQAEHGGNLWGMPTGKIVESSLEEATDQLTYLFTLRQQMRIIMELAYEGMKDDSVCALTARENCRTIWYVITGRDDGAKI